MAIITATTMSTRHRRKAGTAAIADTAMAPVALAAAVAVPLDGFAAKVDPGRERLEGGESHHAARYLLAPPREGLIQLGRVDAMQPCALPGHDDRVAVDHLGVAGQRLSAPAERQDCNEAGREPSEHRLLCAAGPFAGGL